jgi:hypothetical protein
MAQFITDPSFKVGGCREFIMHDDLIYESERFGNFIVQANDEKPFVTDFASIPLIVPKWLLDPMGGGIFDTEGNSRLPAVLHDWLCRRATNYELRVEADKIFREAMKSKGVNRISRNIMYGAVRANTERMRLFGKWR